MGGGGEWMMAHCPGKRGSGADNREEVWQEGKKMAGLCARQRALACTFSKIELIVATGENVFTLLLISSR